MNHYICEYKFQTEDLFQGQYFADDYLKRVQTTREQREMGVSRATSPEFRFGLMFCNILYVQEVVTQIIYWVTQKLP